MDKSYCRNNDPLWRPKFQHIIMAAKMSTVAETIKPLMVNHLQCSVYSTRPDLKATTTMTSVPVNVYNMRVQQMMAIQSNFVNLRTRSTKYNYRDSKVKESEMWSWRLTIATLTWTTHPDMLLASMVARI